jgi:hypothetical protein
VIARAGAVLALIVTSACVGPDSSARYANHYDSGPWSSGFAAQFDDPYQYGPEAVELVALPIAVAFDQQLSDAAKNNQYVTTGNTISGDALSTVLAAGAVTYAGINWANGDDGKRFEVAGEALVATGIVTQTLKFATNRKRPDGGTNDSFPSGHTSLAFCGATLLARSIEADTDSHSKLGYLLWVPATYVAVDRVEAGRHWPSDVVFSALMATMLTNTIWNAHYGELGSSSNSIFGGGAVHAQWQPQVLWTDDGLTLGVGFSF